MNIRFWYGLRQRVGHLGDAQHDFNLLGEIEGYEAVERLRASLNGSEPFEVSIGKADDGFGDGKRLGRNGHFNVDIPMTRLRRGANEIQLTATDTAGGSISQTVTVERLEGDCPLPFHIDWATVSDPQSVGQSVDGHWSVEADGLRTRHTGYDRIFLIGNQTWRDYEVTVPVTIHRVDPETGPRSGPNGVGLLFRFTGHINGGFRNFEETQPKYGYLPFGGLIWLRFTSRGGPTANWQMFRGDEETQYNHGEHAIEEGATYWMRARCETLPDAPDGQGVTRYSSKIWRDGQNEPRDWAAQDTQTSPHALRQGGPAFLAHHVDATFGNARVVRLD